MELRRQLAFAGVRFQMNQNGIALQGQLRNDTQADLEEAFATVAFLDAHAQLIEVDSFSVRFTPEGRRSADFDVYVGGEWPRPNVIERAAPRVDYVVERGARVPEQVPIPPSLR